MFSFCLKIVLKLDKSSPENVGSVSVRSIKVLGVVKGLLTKVYSGGRVDAESEHLPETGSQSSPKRHTHDSEHRNPHFPVSQAVKSKHKEL